MLVTREAIRQVSGERRHRHGGWLVSEKIQLEIDLQVAESTQAAEQEAQAEVKISA